MTESVGLSCGTALGATSSTAGTTITPTPRFVCPYYNVYGRRGAKGRSCTGEGYPNIHRMKEHLYRVHAPPISCPRCYVIFTDQNEVNSHLRIKDICELIPPPAIDETTTFTEAKRLKLKRKSHRNKGNSNEVEQCKEIYQILFPDTSLPDSLYVRDDGSRSGLEQHQAGLITILVDILQKKVPNEAQYADLNARLNEFMETARAAGIVDEAVNQVTHERKRQRVSNDQPHTVCDEPNVVACNSMKSMEDVGIAPLSTTTAERFQSSQSSDKLSSRPLDDFLTNSSSSGPPGFLNTGAVSSFHPNALGQVDNGPSTEPMDFSFEEWLADQELTVLPSDEQTEARGDYAQD